MAKEIKIKDKMIDKLILETLRDVRLCTTNESQLQAIFYYHFRKKFDRSGKRIFCCHKHIYDDKSENYNTMGQIIQTTLDLHIDSKTKKSKNSNQGHSSPDIVIFEDLINTKDENDCYKSIKKIEKKDEVETLKKPASYAIEIKFKYSKCDGFIEDLEKLNKLIKEKKIEKGYTLWVLIDNYPPEFKLKLRDKLNKIKNWINNNPNIASKKLKIYFLILTEEEKAKRQNDEFLRKRLNECNKMLKVK